MSDVVGSCADCIVSLPVVPPTSLKFQVQAQKGMRGVIRQLGSFNAYYPATNLLTEQQVTVEANAAYDLSLPTALTALLLVVSGPVTVTLTKAATVVELEVNKMLIVDDAYTAVTVENLGTVAVDLQLNYATV